MMMRKSEIRKDKIKYKLDCKKLKQINMMMKKRVTIIF